MATNPSSCFNQCMFCLAVVANDVDMCLECITILRGMIKDHKEEAELKQKEGELAKARQEYFKAVRRKSHNGKYLPYDPHSAFPSILNVAKMSVNDSDDDETREK